MTGNAHYQDGFVPVEMRAVFADFNDLEDVKSKITDKTCGIICELYRVRAESIRQRKSS